MLPWLLPGRRRPLLAARDASLPTQSSTVRTLAYLLYIYVDMWLQEDNIMAMAVHVRTILGCRNFHRLNLADQDSARRLVSELAAQVYISMRVAARWMCMNARMHEEVRSTPPV